ncbi:hypothetical protein DFH27DRAFT_528397 [Peziza echinospora]|nr:hypothetical protein DFH27DRAFT_528397 [Peziza echinospora]
MSTYVDTTIAMVERANQLAALAAERKHTLKSTPTVFATDVEFATPRRSGLMNIPNGEDGTKIVLAELLRDNHETNHVFFNDLGFHNHIAHYLLTLYDLGASSETLKETYAREKGYQRPPPPLHPRAAIDLTNEDNWPTYFGNQEHYTDFLAFFTAEIKTLGWRECISKYIFGKSKIAVMMRKNIFGGFYHPVIHFGFGIEFEILSVIAEGLAECATSETVLGDGIADIVERIAEEVDPNRESNSTLLSLVTEIQNNPNIPKNVFWTDGQDKPHALLSRIGPEVAQIVTKFRCKPADLLQKCAETTNVAALLCGASLRPDKQITFDFFMAHMVTTAPFIQLLVNQAWISDEEKCRLMEWKGWTDLLVYASRRGPKLYIDDIRGYVPKVNSKGNRWFNLFERVLQYKDRTGGHGIKLIRALAYAEKCNADFVGKPGFVVEGDMWWKMAAMCMDTHELGEEEYVYDCGYDEAWEVIGPRVRK